MKTNNLNLRSSRMRGLAKMANDVGSANIQTLYQESFQEYINCDLPQTPMNPIPWSNVTFEKPSREQYILRYSNSNPNNKYFTILPTNTSGTINDIKPFIDYSDETQECNYSRGTRGGSGMSRIESGAVKGGAFPTNPPLRIIIIVNDYRVNDYGYFYVDIDDQGNAKLST